MRSAVTAVAGPEYLSGHDETRSLTLDLDISSQQSNVPISKRLTKVPELLVRQCLDRRRVYGPTCIVHVLYSRERDSSVHISVCNTCIRIIKQCLMYIPIYQVIDQKNYFIQIKLYLFNQVLDSHVHV